MQASLVPRHSSPPHGTKLYRCRCAIYTITSSIHLDPQNQRGEVDWISNAGRHKGEGADQTPHVLQQGLDREGDNMGP